MATNSTVMRMRPVRHDPVLRIAAAACCLLYAAVAIGSALERAERSAFLAERPGAAKLGPARRLVAADPFEPHASSLLGTALSESGDVAGAEQAFSLARDLGWRDPATQTFWAARELTYRNYDRAAEHLDALLRQHPDLLERQSLLDPFERDPAARSALARLMDPASEWVRRYSLDWTGLRVQRMVQRGAMLGELARSGRPIGCRAVVGPVDGLVSIGAFKLAQNAWTAHCRDRGAGPLGDSSFINADFSGKNGPFNWTFFPAGELDFRLDTAERSGRRLVISNHGPAKMPIAAQMLIATGGSYRLSWHGQGGAQVTATIGCRPASGEWRQAQRDEGTGNWKIDLTVEAGCEARWLTIGIAANSRAYIERVTLVPLQG